VDTQDVLANKFTEYRDIYARLAEGDRNTIMALVDFINITERETNSSLRRGSEENISDNRIMLRFIDYLKDHLINVTNKLVAVEKIIENLEKPRRLRDMLKFKRPGETNAEVLAAMKFGPE